MLLLSEATNGGLWEEETRLQSAYLAAVIWHREAKGRYTKDEAERELTRLAGLGLDPGVLVASYEAQEHQEVLFGWLDFDFQVSTLRRFFPGEFDALPSEELSQFTRVQAA